MFTIDALIGCILFLVLLTLAKLAKGSEDNALL